MSWWKKIVALYLAAMAARFLYVLAVGEGPAAVAEPSVPQPVAVEVRVGGTKARIRTERITQAVGRARWPFTVDEAVLVCVPDLAEHGAFYVVDGHAFAANGASAMMARIKKIDVVVDGRAQRPETPDASEPTVDRLWALSEISQAQLAADPDIERHWLGRKSIGVMLDAVEKIGCGG